MNVRPSGEGTPPPASPRDSQPEPTPGQSASAAARELAPLDQPHLALLRSLARGPIGARRGASSVELDQLVARGLVASAFVGHAGIELTLTEAGTSALAAIDATPSSSVYEVPAVREELSAFLAAWQPAAGDERARLFKANLAFLLDLAVATALDLERARLRRDVAARVGADGPDRQATQAVLAAVLERPPGPLRGRSSRAVGPRT